MPKMQNRRKTKYDQDGIITGWENDLSNFQEALCNVTAVILTQKEEDIRMRSEEMQKDLLERTQFELVGPYIVFKRNTDDQIRIKRIVKKDPKPTIPEQELRVELKNMFIDDIDIKYVNFFQVPPSYFQSIKLLRTGRDMDLYENIL